jgi:hypothetical protein
MHGSFAAPTPLEIILGLHLVRVSESVTRRVPDRFNPTKLSWAHGSVTTLVSLKVVLLFNAIDIAELVHRRVADNLKVGLKLLGDSVRLTTPLKVILMLDVIHLAIRMVGHIAN